MFTDPIAVNAIGSLPALTLTRVQQDGFGSVWVDIPNGFSFQVTHSSPTDLSKGERHYLKVSMTRDVTLPNGNVQKLTAYGSLVLSVPQYGWTQTEKQNLLSLLLDLPVETEVTIAKVVGFES
jgi:hypothetical protein